MSKNVTIALESRDNRAFRQQDKSKKNCSILSKNFDIRSKASPIYTSSLIMSMCVPTLLSFLVSLRLSSPSYSHSLLILVKFRCPILSLKAFEKFQQQNKLLPVELSSQSLIYQCYTVLLHY